MKKNFNEIDAFFENKTYTMKELDEFKSIVNNKYSGIMLEIANRLIAFELSRKNIKRDTNNNFKPKIINKPSQINKAEKIKNETEFRKKDVAQIGAVKELRGRGLIISKNIKANSNSTTKKQAKPSLLIKDVALELGWSADQLITFYSLSKKQDKLTFEEYNLLKPLIKHKNKASKVYKKVKTKNRTSRTKSKGSSVRGSASVWDKLALYGAGGKIISIRSK